MVTAHSLPLRHTLWQAAENVAAVLNGRSLAHLPTTPAAQAHSFYTLRYLGLGQTLREAMVPRKPKSDVFDALLMQSLLLLCAEDTAPRYDPFTVVNEAVEAVKAQPQLASLSGLLNGVLRRFLREKGVLVAQAKKKPLARWNHPAWWVKALRRAYPQQWERILATANVPAPMDLRVNTRRSSVAQVLKAFAHDNIQAAPIGENGLRLEQPRPVTELPAFNDGWYSVQDRNAQRAGELLQLADGMRVLDACAAPGGKTAHLLEQANIHLTALDSDAQRLKRVAENLQRLGLGSATGSTVKLQAAPAQHLKQWWDGEQFDAILADVPCTASGIVRRHPDIRWLRRPSDIADTAALQADIISALWSTLRVGGQLLYVTCSVFPEEGHDQIQHFLANHPNATLHPQSPAQLLPSTDGDGFYYALLEKTVPDPVPVPIPPINNSTNR